MADFSEVKNNLILSLVLVLVIYVFSTLFFHNVEGWSYLDSIYFVTMTITTIGYGDFVPATDIGKIFSIFLALIGISVAFFLIYSIAAYREHTFDRELIGRLAMFKKITSLRAGKKKPRFIKGLRSKIGEI
jgi:voltage-gated potassium channel Kch